MISRLSCLYAVSAAGLLLVPSVAAQRWSAKDSLDALVRIRQERKDNFSKWTGVLFYCDVGGADRVVGDGLCELFFGEAPSFSRVAGVRADTTRHAEAGIFVGLLPNAELLFELKATSAPGVPAVSISIRARKRVDAVTRIFKGSEPTDTTTRHGDLILWEQSAIASGGTARDLVSALSPVLKDIVREFMADFVEGRRP